MDLTDSERDVLVALKLRHAYNRTPADDIIQVSDLENGELIERDATFLESWAPIRRELSTLPANELDAAKE